MTKIPHNYAKGVASLGQYSPESAFWAFNYVANFVYPKYSLAINDVKSAQSELEGTFISRQETIEKTALALLKNSRGEAVDYLSNYSNEMADLTFKRWKKLGEFLLVKYMDGVVKDENFKPINVGYPDEFKKRIVQEAGDYLKVKKLPGADLREYHEKIAEADTLLKEHKYSEAKEAYQKALELKKDESYPKSQLEKLAKILSEIDELHKKNFSN
jgi:hypothetical protein